MPDVEEKSIPPIGGHAVPKRTRTQKIAWVVISVSLVLLVLAVTVPLWLPWTARRVIPDRYIVAYAPEGLQELIFDSDPLKTLPTPVAAQPGLAPDLLNDPPVIVTTPTVASTLAPPTATTESVQQTPVPIGPTPTLTPAFVAEGGEDAPPVSSALPASILMTEFVYTPQGWNKCGPATLTMLLSYWGIEVTQNDVSNAIKPHPEDSNVTPHELAAYVETLGYGMVVRINGRVDLLKELVAAGYPVMIERGFDELPDKGWMGHYMLVIGYSEEDQEFYNLDAYWGLNRVHEDPDFPLEAWSYDQFDRVWRHFNRSYMVVYSPEQAADVARIIGQDMDDTAMYVNALQRTQDELRLNSDDVFGWFNLGTILTELGDYESAAAAYDQARAIGLPFRMLWYQFDLYEAYYQVGRYEDLLTLTNIILDVENYPESEEAFYYRGRVYEARGQVRAARHEYSQALHYNPTFTLAAEALSSLEDE